MSEFHKGKQLQEEGTLEEAIAAYHRTLELNSNDSWAYHHMGEALTKLGRFDEAVTAFRHAIELKPDFSWSYHHLGDALAQQQQWEESATAFGKAIELNPEHFGTYVGLGNSLAKLGQLDEAIAAYSRASELNPDADWIHSALANAVQQRNQSDLVAEASASYPQIIELDPDNVEAYQHLLQLQPDNWEVGLQLGNTLVQQGKLEEAIAVYHRAIEHNPHNQTAYYGLEESLAKLGQLEEAIATYRQAIELSLQEKQKASTLDPTEEREEAIKRYRQVIEDNPDNISEYYKLLELQPDRQEVWLQLAQALVRQGKLEEAIAVSRRLIELSPREEYYQQLGEVLGKLSNWDEAIACYHRAIELNPNYYDTYYHLGEVLTQQGKINEATRIYHQLSILLAQKGYIDEAIATFKKIPHQEARYEEIYKNIWQGLNHLRPLDANNTYYPTDLKLTEAYEYFSKENHYKILHLQCLTDEQKVLLEEAGLSIGNLELIREDNIALEEIYINNFNDSPHSIQLAKQVDRDVTTMLWHTCPSRIRFQQSIVETGYIYSVCPRSGKILRSNQSIMHKDIIFYRFVGSEVFYLTVHLWQGDKVYLYFPRTEIIINLRNEVHGINIIDLINGFKGDCVSQWKVLIDYFSNNHKEIVSLTGLWGSLEGGNLGHYFWNEITGIEYLNKNGILSKIERFLVGYYDSFNVSDIFPEVPVEKVIRFANHRECSNFILKNNYCAVRVTDIFIKDYLSEIIHEMALKKCDREFLHKVEEASKAHIPLLWINLRSHSKSWLSQVEGYAKIINTLHKDYPNIGIVFDGFSDEQNIMESIISLIPPTVRTYNALNCLLYETIVWAYAVDLYIAVLGSGLTLVTWLANKPGVAHSNTAHCGQQYWWSTVRENAIPPSFVPRELIIDQDASLPYCNYDLDWKIIYSEVKKIMESFP